MLKRVIKELVLVLVTVFFGVGIAAYRVVKFDDQKASIINGVWKADREVALGSDKLLTARVAVAALFALRKSEVIYMLADKDDGGAPLSAENDYIISGVPIDARYWSITLYGNDYFLVPNEIDRFSFNRKNIRYEKDSTFALKISATKKDGNWLPSPQKGKFYLLLRMYHPAPQIYEKIADIKLPVVQKAGKI